MIDQRIRKAKTTGQHIEITALRTGVRINRQTGSSIKLDLLFFGLCCSDQRININRISQFFLEEGFSLIVETRNLHLLHDMCAFSVIDMAISLCSGNHCLNECKREAIAHRRGLRMKWRIRWRWRQQLWLFCYRLFSGLWRLAGLIIFVGEITKARDCSDTARSCHITCKLTSGFCAQDCSRNRPRSQWVFLREISGLPCLVTNAS